MRAVLDSNIFVSAFLFGGNPARILQCAEERTFTLLTSPPLRDEVEEVLARKFSWPRNLIRTACDPLWELSVSVSPQFLVDRCSDPDDNRVLECAAEGKANFIVTGDNHLLTIKIYRKIKIVNPSVFLKLL